MRTESFSFQEVATTILGGFTGCLLALPFLTADSPATIVYALVGTALGLMLGYRRRQSRFFFYVCLLSVLVLSSLLVKSITPGVPVQ